MFSVQIFHLLLHQFYHTFRGINRKIRIFRVSDFPLCGKVVVCSRIIQSSCRNDHFRKKHTVHISVYLMLIVIEHTHETVCPIADPFSGSALAAQLYGILCLLKFEANAFAILFLTSLFVISYFFLLISLPDSIPECCIRLHHYPTGNPCICHFRVPPAFSVCISVRADTPILSDAQPHQQTC